MELLCALFVALLVITLVGHGIWVACAAVLRLFRAEPARERQANAGPSRSLDVHAPTEEIDIALRQVRGLFSRGELDADTTGRLVEALLARRRALLGEEEPEPQVETVRVAPAPLPPPPAVEPVRVFDAEPAEEEQAPPAPVPIPVPTPPPPPRRSLGELVSGFMEESNILWGELVGGLLIVGCSIALVLTLWGSLQSVPYFPFLMFTALTVALFGAGQYTLHHWKLASTSRGLLLIAMLLVPLNLLVLADPSARGAAVGPSWVDVLVDIAALGLLAAVVHAAGASLIGAGLLPGPVDRRWLLALAVVGAPGAQLLAQHLFDAPIAGPPPWAWLALAGVAAGCHLVANGALFGGLTVYGHREARLNREQAHAVFSFLGLAAFSLVAAFGFLVTRLAVPADGLTSLAAPLTLGGVPGVALGLLVLRRLADDEPAATRTAGTGVALAGLAVMLAGVALAWPAPGPVFATLLLTGVTLTAAAFAARAAWAHAGGVPALALAAVVGYHLVAHVGDPSTGLLASVTSAESGLVLAGVAVALTIVAARLTQADKSDALARGALAVGAAALLLVTAHGVRHPFAAAVVHGVCAVAAGAATRRWPRAFLAHLAAVVVVPGTLWALWGTHPGRLPLWGLVLACEALAMQFAARWLTSRAADLQGEACDRAALLAGAVAIALPLSAGLLPQDLFNTGTALVLAAALFSRVGAGWFVGGQLALVAAVLLGVTWWVEPLGWLTEPIDPRSLHVYGLALGALWLVAEVARRRWPALPWEAFGPGVDRGLGGLLVVGHLLLAGLAAWGAGAQEWGLIDPAAVQRHLAVVAGPMGWLLTLVLALPLLVSLRRSEGETSSARHGAVVELMLLAVSSPLLYAAWHTFDLAGASAARWALAACFLGSAMLTWGRGPLGAAAARLGFDAPPAHGSAYTLFAAVAVAVVALTAYLTMLGFTGQPLPGPLPGSIFAQMGPTWSSVGPLLLVVAGLVGTAARERWPGYALAAGLLLPASVMGGYALGLVQAGHTLDDGKVTFISLLGCQVSAIAALAWLVGRRWVGEGWELLAQSWLGLVGVVALSALAFPLLFLHQAVADGGYAVLGGPAGWAALALSAAAAWWHSNLDRPAGRVHVAGWAGLAAGVLAMCSALRWDVASPWWLSFHVLAGVWGGAAAALAAGWASRLERPARGWLAVYAALMTLLALRGAVDSTVYPAAPPACALAASALMATVALGSGRGGYTHASGLLFTLATVLAWAAYGPVEPPVGALSLVVGLAVSATFWWAAEPPGQRGSRVAYSPLATVASLGLLAGLVAAVVAADLAGERVASVFTRFAWPTVAVVALPLYLSVRARYFRLGLPGLYVLGLVAAGLALHAQAPTPSQWGWMSALALAAHAAAVGAVVRAWQWYARQTGESALMLAEPALPDREWGWLRPAQLVVGGAAVALAFAAAVTQPTLPLRLTGFAAVALLVPAAWWLSRARQEPEGEQVRLGALALGVLALAALAWGLPDPTSAAPWLTRNAGLLVALTAASAAGLESLRRWPNGRTFALAVGGCAVVTAVVLIGQMLPAFDPLTRRTPLPPAAVASVALAVAGLIALALRLSLQGDPVGSSERGRMHYVYLAEVLLLLLFLHARLNVPELFLGYLARYWSFLVLGVAFGGIALGEWAARRGVRVLSVPLTNTAVLLPLLPLLAFWARPPQALLAFADDHAPGLRPVLGYLSALPWDFDAHALVWFLSSALYALLATARRSTGWALTASLAATFGFWALLAHSGVGFLVHPQAWVIPLALIVLVAEYLHREDLSPATAEGLRYLGITTAYVASTADVWVNGIAAAPWLPAVLALLCVLGVLAGILLRVRAFLFLGVGFLLVDVLTMIWHAAVTRQHTWLWWASGILLGVTILALFAVFEKRRNDVLRLLDELRRWD
jgi:hypothetical protein